ncbi:hypothetical protein BHE74_00056018 [Ensete ventricosum]|nr:hypothetical protein BHE74_00056018 [Ensete ventricosum]
MQDLIFDTLIKRLEKVFPGGENDMTNADLAAKSLHPRTAGPPTPDTSKVGTPHLQTHASLQVQQAWWEGTMV